MKDVLIIGSGPAGLSASIYAKRANLDVLVAEKEYLGTGQIAESAQVDNYLGIAGKSGYELGETFRQHAEAFHVPFYEAEAIKLTRENGVWHTEFDNGETIQAKAVIYAAGSVHRRLQVPGEAALIGNGVSFCALCDGSLYQGKTAAVIGGGDTALDDALYLSNIRGSDKSVLQIQNTANIEAVLSANVAEIIGSDQVEAIRLDNGREIAVDGVFIAIGMVPQTNILKNIIEIDPYGYAVSDETGRTKAPGLFVAGDVRTKTLRQIVTAVSDGANAAVSAVEYLKSLND